MTRLHRCLAFALILLACALPARAQPYPSARPVTLYVQFPPGGPGDLTARTLAEHFKRITGQTMLIENRPGGGSTVALNALLQQKPDGYTLSMMGRSAMTTYWMQEGRIGFHPVEDLTYVCSLAGTYFALVARSDLPFTNLRELVAYAKANPGKLTFGTIGHGLWTHQPMVEFMQLAGIDMLHVPYKGDADSIAALAGGHLDLAVTGGTVQPFVESGRVRMIAFLTPRRVPRFPEVPTFTELGYPVRASVVVGIGGPKGMDPEVVKFLDETFRRISEDADFRLSLEKIHQVPEYMSHEQATAWAKRQFLLERDIVEKFNLRPARK